MSEIPEYTNTDKGGSSWQMPAIAILALSARGGLFFGWSNSAKLDAAKQAVTAFLDSIGYGTVDAGSLADSWRQEPGTPVYGAPYGPFSLEKGTPASEETIRAALAAATR